MHTDRQKWVDVMQKLSAAGDGQRYHAPSFTQKSMPHGNESNYMRSKGFTRRLRFMTTTPTELYGKCCTASIEANLFLGSQTPTIDTYSGRPHKDPNYHEPVMVSYYLTDADFERHSWLRLADRIVAWMSVVFGKQFTRPVFTQVNGNWEQPTNFQPEKIWNRELPFYSGNPRVDEGEKLDLRSLGVLENIVYSTSIVSKRLNTAAEFYSNALRSWFTDPERAYLDLITAGECLTDLHSFDWNDLADDESKRLVAALRNTANESLARFYEGRATFIASRYVSTLLKDLPDSFLSTTEYAMDAENRFTAETLSKALKKSYHLRSVFVHDGAEFGTYTSILAARARAEMWHDFDGSIKRYGHSEADGASKLISSKLLREIGKAATFIGLERITRAAIIRLCKRNWQTVVSGCDRRMTGPLPPDRYPILGQWVKVHPDDAPQKPPDQ